jgi:hypothetical protein
MENQAPQPWSFDDIVGPIGPLLTKQEFGVSIGIALPRLAVLYKSGAMHASLSKLRQNLDIDVLDFDEDYFPGPENSDINIWTFSTYLSELTDTKSKYLIESVIRELRRLDLPLTLIENYIGGLLYDWEVRPSLFPATMLGELSILDSKFGNLNLNTQDKKYLTQQFRKIFNIPARGRIPKDKLKAWAILEKNILSGKGKIRKYRRTDLKLAALEAKPLMLTEDSRKWEVHSRQEIHRQGTF